MKAKTEDIIIKICFIGIFTCLGAMLIAKFCEIIGL